MWNVRANVNEDVGLGNPEGVVLLVPQARARRIADEKGALQRLQT